MTGERRAVWRSRPCLAPGVLVAAIAGLALAVVAAQVSPGDIDFSFSGFTGGGGQSTGDTYRATGAIGQPFAGGSEGGSYHVDSGLLGGGGLAGYSLFVPGVARE